MASDFEPVVEPEAIEELLDRARADHDSDLSIGDRASEPGSADFAGVDERIHDQRIECCRAAQIECQDAEGVGIHVFDLRRQILSRGAKQIAPGSEDYFVAVSNTGD